jgi:hypothetical protein
MSTTISSRQYKSAPRWTDEKPSGDATVRQTDMDWSSSKRLPLGKRASRVPLLITFCIGLVAALAWQAYGDAARETIASTSPRLGWLAPPAAPVTQAAPAVPSPDQEDLKAISFGLAAVRQRVDQIAADLAAGQDQMTRDIGQLLAAEQDILDKMISAPPPQPAAPPARKPVPQAQPVR